MGQKESPFIQTSIGKVSVEEGYVCIEMTEEVITATDIDEHIATLMPLVEQAGVSMPVLLDMGPLLRSSIPSATPYHTTCGHPCAPSKVSRRCSWRTTGKAWIMRGGGCWAWSRSAGRLDSLTDGTDGIFGPVNSVVDCVSV